MEPLAEVHRLEDEHAKARDNRRHFKRSPQVPVGGGESGGHVHLAHGHLLLWRVPHGHALVAPVVGQGQGQGLVLGSLLFLRLPFLIDISGLPPKPDFDTRRYSFSQV